MPDLGQQRLTVRALELFGAAQSALGRGDVAACDALCDQAAGECGRGTVELLLYGMAMGEIPQEHEYAWPGYVAAQRAALARDETAASGQAAHAPATRRQPGDGQR